MSESRLPPPARARRIRQTLLLSLALTVAGLLAALRLLPYWLDAYPQQAARIVGSYLNFPLQAGEISSSWQGWRLILEARAVKFPKLDGRGSRAQIELLRLELLPLSLPHRQWPGLRRVVVKGLLAELRPPRIGASAAPWRPGQFPESFSMQEFARSHGRTLPEKDLFFLDSELRWLPATDEHQPLPPLSIPSLRLQRRKGGILVDATVAPPASYGDPWRLRFDSRGPLGKGNGLLHIASEGLEPARWLPPGRVPGPLRPTAGRLQGEAWLDWRRGKLESLQGRLAGELRLQTAAGQRLHPRKLSAQFVGDRDGKEWHYYGARIETMATDSGPWPPTELRLAQAPTGAERQLLLNRLALRKLPELLPLLPEKILKKEWTARVPPNAGGELRNLLLRTGAGAPSLELELAEVELAGGKLLRRASGVGGRAWIGDDGIRARLHGREMVLDIPRLFDIPLELVRPRAFLHWEPAAERPRLRFLPATAQLSGAHCKLHGTLYWPGQRRPAAADLYVRVEDAAARDVLRHLPVKIGAGTRRLMETTIRSGKVRLGRIVYRGAFADFPFAANEGRFQTRIRLQQSQVALRGDSLPPLRDTSGNLEFDESSFRSRFAGGSWNGLRVIGGQIEIRDMKEPQPELQVRLQGDLESVREWPAAEGLRLPAGWRGGGEAELEAHFRLSASRAVGAWPIPERGRLKLRQGWLKPPVGPGLSDIRGTVEVRDGALVSEGLHANYRGDPLRIHLRYRPDKAPRFAFTARGKIGAETIAAEIERWGLAPADTPSSFVAGRLQGASDWQATYRAHEETWRLELHSPLRGLAVRLPSPLGKTAAEERTLSLRLERPAAEASPALAWRYGRQLQGSYRPDARAGLPARFSVQGQIGMLSMAEWSELLSELPRNQPVAPPSLLGDTRLQLDRLELFGAQYHDISAAVEATPEAWRVSLSGSELDGELHIPARPDPTWSVALSRLSLAGPKLDLPKTSQKPDVDPRTMPTVAVTVQELLRDGTSLGSLHIATERIESGQDLRLKLESEGLLLDATGTWEQREETTQTAIELTLTAEELAHLYRLLGAPSPTQKAPTRLRMSLDWPGSLADYNLTTMRGTLDIDLGKGRLRDIQSGASGLFGILNLQSLLRRLRLDFSDLFDVFRKGLSFDSIAGRLRLEDGNAYTDDLTVRAPGIDIYISGRSGWAERDYDQEIAAIPNLSSNWPLYGVLFGGIPGAGIGGAVLLLDRWFGQGKANFDRILTRKYHMTGNWEEPRIVRLRAELEQPQNGFERRSPLGGGIPEPQ
ncbi:MAG: DUF3971 domain-containing protein [Gammaproteobacteria bacterium]|nr:DUF3971 domain-containing protein [Gammaproteobacteria bacterium]